MIVFCRYATLAPAERARGRAAERDERRSPAAQKTISFGELRGAPSSVQDADGVEQPGADRDEVEDADDVVGRRVVGALLVAVVEAVELRRDDPERQRREEDRPPRRADVATAGRRAGYSRLRDEEREQQPDEVGGEQHPAHQPTAALDPRRPPAPLEDLERPLVDGPSARRRARVPARAPAVRLRSWSRDAPPCRRGPGGATLRIVPAESSPPSTHSPCRRIRTRSSRRETWTSGSPDAAATRPPRRRRRRCRRPPRRAAASAAARRCRRRSPGTTRRRRRRRSVGRDLGRAAARAYTTATSGRLPVRPRSRRRCLRARRAAETPTVPERRRPRGATAARASGGCSGRAA